MKKFLIFSILCPLLLLTSCSTVLGMKGDGNITKKEFAISDYTSVETSRGIKVVYKQSNDKPYAILEIDNNLLPYLEVVVENNTLKVKADRSLNNFRPTKFILYTSSKDLKAINTSGGSKFVAESSIKVEELSTSSSGGSDIYFKEVNARTLKSSTSGGAKVRGEDKIVATDFTFSTSGGADIILSKIEGSYINGSASGGGTIKLSGSVVQGEFGASGGADITANGLTLKNASCSASGGGSVYVNVSESLKASASGGGSVKYSGNPQVNKSTSGGGSVRQVN